LCLPFRYNASSEEIVIKVREKGKKKKGRYEMGIEENY